jgi:hypothetical protein
MLFCISADSPAHTPCHARGRWTVDAEDGQLAIAKLLMLINSKLWPGGSAWSISVLCEDCPYRADGHTEEWPERELHCGGRR